MVAGWLWPFSVAVTMALWLLLTVPEVAVKVALLWPERDVTLAGTVSNPLLLASVTVAALVAALFNVTVQVLDALLPRRRRRAGQRMKAAPEPPGSWCSSMFTPPALAVTTPV